LEPRTLRGKLDVNGAPGLIRDSSYSLTALSGIVNGGGKGYADIGGEYGELNT
jgi:hypothetical protein